VAEKVVFIQMLHTKRRTVGFAKEQGIHRRRTPGKKLTIGARNVAELREKREDCLLAVHPRRGVLVSAERGRKNEKEQDVMKVENELGTILIEAPWKAKLVNGCHINEIARMHPNGCIPHRRAMLLYLPFKNNHWKTC